MKHTLFILIIILSMFSCNESDGKQGDTIKLSADKLFSPAEGGEFVVTTQGKFWWITDYSIVVDSIKYDIKCGDTQCENNRYWSYNGIDFQIEMYDLRGSLHIKKIEGPWFTINKVSEQKMVFSILPNDTGETHSLTLGLEDGDFFTGIALTQFAN